MPNLEPVGQIRSIYYILSFILKHADDIDGLQIELNKTFSQTSGELPAFTYSSW